jgi:hypothetical protein
MMLSTSADVFVCVFTSAYNRDVAAKFYNKIWPPSPPSALALFGKYKLLR